MSPAQAMRVSSIEWLGTAEKRTSARLPDSAIFVHFRESDPITWRPLGVALAKISVSSTDTGEAPSAIER